MKISRSKTLLVGFIISRSGLTYTIVLFEVFNFGHRYRFLIQLLFDVTITYSFSICINWGIVLVWLVLRSFVRSRIKKFLKSNRKSLKILYTFFYVELKWTVGRHENTNIQNIISGIYNL